MWKDTKTTAKLHRDRAIERESQKRDTPEIGSLRRERERKKRVDRKEDQTELEKRKDSRAEERDRVKSKQQHINNDKNLVITLVFLAIG